MPTPGKTWTGGPNGSAASCATGCSARTSPPPGSDITGALIGETWRIGTAVVQVTGPRIPCVTFQSWMDEPHWVKRFAAAGRPGAYLRVLAEGAVGAGDQAEVLDRPAARVTVAESMRAYYGDRT